MEIFLKRFPHQNPVSINFLAIVLNVQPFAYHRPNNRPLGDVYKSRSFSQVISSNIQFKSSDSFSPEHLVFWHVYRWKNSV